MEDYTNKYKGEQVEVALFGGEYQEGVLTAYCYVEDVAHIELNGHILVPLQNIASLHCSSRCDAPEPDWPPRGLEDDRRRRRRLGRAARSRRGTSRRSGCSLVGVSAALGGIGWLLGGYRLLSVFVFCGLLLALGDVLVLGPDRPRDARRARAAGRARRPDSTRPSSGSRAAPGSPSRGST